MMFSRSKRPYIDETVEIPETIVIEGKQAFCNGAGPSGHPGVYLNLGSEGHAVCPYCNQVFANHPS